MERPIEAKPPRKVAALDLSGFAIRPALATVKLRLGAILPVRLGGVARQDRMEQVQSKRDARLRRAYEATH